MKHGFVNCFQQRPEVDLAELEKKIKEIIRQNLPIQTAGENIIAVGKDVLPCTGTQPASNDLERSKIFGSSFN